MSDDAKLSPAQLAEQVARHLEGLAAAGVQWLPRVTTSATPANPAVTPSGTQPLDGPTPKAIDSGRIRSLFEEETMSTEETPELSPDERRLALTVLAEKVAGCTRCEELASTRTQTVFGVGPIDVELCFIGEAPGADEDRTGEPFVGAAGQLLNRIIAACGMKREEVFICNILRCRPPGNRPPKAAESDNCREWLDGTLAQVKPKFICTLGATATQQLLGVKTPIGRMRGKFFEYRGIPVMCTYHPASLLEGRSPERKKDVWEDMKMLLTKMGRPIPQGGSKPKAG